MSKKERRATEEAEGSEQPGKLKRTAYEAKLDELHMELEKMQYWIKATGKKIVVLFEERDAAGKGGVIKCVAHAHNLRVPREKARVPGETNSLENQRFLPRLNRRKSLFCVAQPLKFCAWGYLFAGPVDRRKSDQNQTRRTGQTGFGQRCD